VREPGSGEVTALLRAWHGGDQEAYRHLSEVLYNELRSQARRHMRRHRDTLLPPTALVHEAFTRLAGAQHIDWRDRGHFLAVAACTMRRVLVDLARARAARKRGARATHVPLESDVAAAEPPLVDLIALDTALEALAAVDPRKVQVVELRFFGGLTVAETAQVLNVSPDTVARDWRMARSWLLRQLDGGSPSPVR
jgi:RNA polymerase sigma-70 factor, ECF subfamily